LFSSQQELPEDAGMVGIRLVCVMSVATLAAACSSAPPPRSLPQAALAVDSAQQANAELAAPLEMQVAREKLDAARAAARDDNNATAERLAEEALVNAELAQAKQEEAQARSAQADVERAAPLAPRPIPPRPMPPQLAPPPPSATAPPEPIR
jgi:hypothetical protein